MTITTSQRSDVTPYARSLSAFVKADAITLGKGLASLSVVAAVLYFWGAAYYAGYFAGLGFGEQTPRLEKTAYLVASWQAVADASLWGIKGLFLIIIAALATSLLSAGENFLLEKRRQRRAASASLSADTSPRMAAIYNSVDDALTLAFRQCSLTIVAGTVLAGTLYETSEMLERGKEAAATTLGRCRDAAIVIDGALPERLKYCTRIGDQLLFQDSVGAVLIEASRVSRIAIGARAASVGARQPGSTIPHRRLP